MKNLKVRNESFDAIVAGTVTDYDLALSQASITDERKKVVDFTRPVLPEPAGRARQGRLQREGQQPRGGPEDPVGRPDGHHRPSTCSSDLIKPSKEPRVYQSLSDAYAALDAGQVDAVLIDTAINLGQAARSKGKYEVISQFAQPDGPDTYGGIVPKGSTNLTADQRGPEGAAGQRQARRSWPRAS